MRGNYDSKGAGIRTIMNFFPAIILLALRSFWNPIWGASKVWNWVAVGVILSAPALFVSTTMLDRLGFYLIGIQPYVLVRLPGLFSAPVVRGAFVCMIILGYAAVLWVWFSYAHHVEYWRPYASGLFQ